MTSVCRLFALSGRLLHPTTGSEVAVPVLTCGATLYKRIEEAYGNVDWETCALYLFSQKIERTKDPLPLLPKLARLVLIQN